MEVCPHPDCRHPIDNETVSEVLKKNFGIEITHMCFHKGPCNHKQVLWADKNKSKLNSNGLPDSYMPGYCKITSKSVTNQKEPASPIDPSQSEIRGPSREAERG